MKLISNDFKFNNHPGGVELIEYSKLCNKYEQYILFLSSHMHTNYHKVSEMCNKMGIKSPILTDGCVSFIEFNNIINDLSIKHKYKIIAYDILSFILSVVILPLSFLFKIFYPLNIFSNIFNIITMLYYSFNIFHMRHHCGYLFNKTIYSIIKPYYNIIDNTFMRNTDKWIKDHQLSHHIYTNKENDHDYYSPYPLICYSNTQKKLWFHKYSNTYVFILYFLNEIINPFQEVYIQYKISWIHGFKQFLYFILHHLILNIVPIIVNPSIPKYYILFAYILQTSIISLLTSFLFQISHNHMENHSSLKTNFPNSFDEWVKMQIEESSSWGGLFSCILFGGINYQTEHHITCACSPIILHYLHPYVVSYAKKNKINYIYEPSFFHGVYSYLNRLKIE